MKSLTLAMIASAAVALPTVNTDDFVEHKFTNLVDHFDFQDSRTYEQRYWVNDVYWTDQSGPNFVYICGEWRCSAPYASSMYPFMLGAEHGARLFVLEHRFYGDSQPFDDWSLQSLRYLSSEQAMADLAYFLGSMNKDDITRPTVVIGGSYPGALSAWFKSRYPHLAVAAWSSSGVVQAIPDMWQFDERIYDATVKSGLFCPQMIKETNEFATQQALLRDEGAPNLIDPVVAGTDAATIRSDDFMFYYADIFVTSVQYGNRTTLCSLLKSLEGQDQTAIFNAMIAHGTEIGVMPADYDTDLLANTTIDVNTSGRQWTYQYCTEYGFFQTPSEIHPMRSRLLDPEYWPKMCDRVFSGLSSKKKARAFSTWADQGGWNTQGTNIFFTNGSEDPWQVATQENNRAFLGQISEFADCDTCGHCGDFHTPSDSTPASMVTLQTHIAEWLDVVLASHYPQSFLQ